MADRSFILCLLEIYNYILFSQKHSVVLFKANFSVVMKLSISTSIFDYNILATEYVMRTTLINM